MPIPVRLPVALALLMASAGCATPASPQASATPGDTPPAAATNPDATPPADKEPDMACQAEKGQWAVGLIADDALVAKVLADTTSERVRVIKPGMAVTMDYRHDRVNLDVDADGRVTAVRCT